MKILFLLEYPIDLPGGGQLSTWTLCDGLVKHGFEPVVACPSLLTKKKSDFAFKIAEYRSDENRERSRSARVLNFVKRIGSFFRIIRSEKPDLIHVSMSESLITFGFLRCLGFFKDIPFVYTDRGLAYGYRRHSLACIKATLKRASGMICTTQFNKDLWLEKKVQVPVTVIPNTISGAFDIYDGNMREIMRKKAGIGEDDLVIGFAGRISEEKDWDFAPVLVKALKDEGIRFKVALVISVYEDQDNAIVDSVKGGIVSSIGEENLIYMQDLSQKDIADYYYMVDVFVMTSMFESFGKAAVEAMSRKCCVVSTAVGGLPEVIGKEENLYTKDTVDKFVSRIKKLSEDRAELDADREFFYNRYRNLYTKENHVMRHVELYTKIAGPAKTGDR
ncbi:MAG: glycosyltransferase family 4 protein [Lachnospiraceae bacterium]|nr:glycosyltransferase family 4 protein [Lachnospiraceae bacterium]